MTACSRRNFVSGMGAVILMTGTSITSLAKEEKAEQADAKAQPEA